jgi:hypothetical protein
MDQERFFQRISISSSDLPFVSGTFFQTNRTARIHIIAYNQYAKPWLNFSTRKALPSSTGKDLNNKSVTQMKL